MKIENGNLVFELEDYPQIKPLLLARMKRGALLTITFEVLDQPDASDPTNNKIILVPLHG